MPERRTRHRAQQFFKTAVVSAAVIIVSLGAWGIFESHQRRQIEKELHYSHTILSTSYVEATQTDQAMRLLDKIPAERRSWVWGYLQRLCHRELVTLRGHDGALTSLAFSPNDGHLATAGADGTVRVWDPRKRTEIMRLAGHTGAVASLAFDPDGARLVTSGMDATVRVWDLASRRELLTITGHDDPVLCVVFSPDGQRLATASWDGTARLWGASSGDQLRVFSGHRRGVPSVAFSPDGTRLATGGSDLTTRLWDADTAKELTTLVADWPRAVWSVAFSPDGTRLATAGNGVCPTILWDLQTGNSLKPFPSFQGVVASVAFSPDGRRLATGSRGSDTIRVWDIDTEEESLRPMRHAGASCVAFDADGERLASAGSDGVVRIWDADPSHDPLALTGSKDRVGALAFGSDGTRLDRSTISSGVRGWPPAATTLVKQSDQLTCAVICRRIGLTTRGMSSNARARAG